MGGDAEWGSMEATGRAHPTLSAGQLDQANTLIREIQARIVELAAGDEDVVFAFRRKIAKELTYLERSKPTKRKRLKARLWRNQNGRCAECHKEMEAKGSILDRKVAKLGYTDENVELIHRSCDEKRQLARNYAVADPNRNPATK